MISSFAALSGRPIGEILSRMFPRPLSDGDPERWWLVLGVLCTVAIVTYVYKDNVLFRVAEHILIGVAMGYSVCAVYFNVGQVDFVIPVFREGEWMPLIPAFLGILMCFRVFPKLSWLSRFPLAMLVGMGMGQALPRSLQANVFFQVYGAERVDFAGYLSQGTFEGYMAALGGVILIVGSLCALLYFYFSKAHRGFIGGAAKIGIALLMIGFGASFGYTVQARISLFAARVLFVLRDWMGVIT